MREQRLPRVESTRRLLVPRGSEHGTDCARLRHIATVLRCYSTWHQPPLFAPAPHQALP